MPNAISFLDDIADEIHRKAIESGNLKLRKREVSWSDENSWKTLGVEAVIQRLYCTCGFSYDHFIGLFSREETPSGKKRLQALSANASLSGERTVQISPHAIGFCPACLSHSFPNYTPE